ncbi:MAG: sugar transferase [Hyphomicrobiales bacterium]|nr:MAG: sugar transferase [Hyphomicrobiales bacterium]
MSILNAGLGGAAVATAGRGPRGGTLKRAFDFTCALLMLIAFLPLMGFVALLMQSFDRGPVLFGHSRIGFNGRVFKCLKFRSMVPDAAEVLERHLAENPAARAEWDASQKLRDDPRVTALGRFLRSTSLDELPQLINVLRGDMSLVGPRPIVHAELPRYGSDVEAYMAARPGITGLWQVSGRSDTDYDRRVQLDSEYVQNWSLFGDVAILLRTVKVVFSRSGSY